MLSADVIARRRLLALVHRLAAKTRTTWDDIFVEHRVITRAVHVIPAAVLYFGLPLIPELGDTAVRVMRNVVFAYAVVMLVAAISGAQ